MKQCYLADRPRPSRLFRYHHHERRRKRKRGAEPPPVHPHSQAAGGQPVRVSGQGGGCRERCRPSLERCVFEQCLSNVPANETRLARPPTYGRSPHWRSKRNAAEFSCVDGTDKIIRTYRGWNGTQHTWLVAAGTMMKAEKALVAQQNAESVALGIKLGNRLTQAPYREYRRCVSQGQPSSRHHLVSHSLLILPIDARRGPVAVLRVLRPKAFSSIRILWR